MTERRDRIPAVLDTSFWVLAYRAEIAANCLDLFDIIVPKAVAVEIMAGHDPDPIPFVIPLKAHRPRSLHCGVVASAAIEVSATGRAGPRDRPFERRDCADSRNEARLDDPGRGAARGGIPTSWWPATRYRGWREHAG